MFFTFRLDSDPKQIFLDPGKSSGSNRIRIHNTSIMYRYSFGLYFMPGSLIEDYRSSSSWYSSWVLVELATLNLVNNSSWFIKFKYSCYLLPNIIIINCIFILFSPLKNLSIGTSPIKCRGSPVKARSNLDSLLGLSSVRWEPLTLLSSANRPLLAYTFFLEYYSLWERGLLPPKHWPFVSFKVILFLSIFY